MHDELEAHETSVLIIGGGGSTRAALVARLLRSPYPILADRQRQVYTSYGLDRVVYLIQRSGTVLIDRTGTVRYLRSSANPRGALDRGELLDRIRRLRVS